MAGSVQPTQPFTLMVPMAKHSNSGQMNASLNRRLDAQEWGQGERQCYRTGRGRDRNRDGNRNMLIFEGCCRLSFAFLGEQVWSRRWRSKLSFDCLLRPHAALQHF